MHEKRIHQAYVISISLKGLHALVEVIGGIALNLFSTDSILRLLYRVDRHDGFARYFTPNEHRYYAFYLLSHGLANLVIVGGLLRERMWAYPATFAVLTLFIAFQMHRFYYVGDPGLIVLSLLDVIVMALSWHEYRLVKRRHGLR
jgi:uncharacterized membrane protein